MIIELSLSTPEDLVAWKLTEMIAFYLPGGLPVYTFSILLGLGSALGLAWAGWQAHPRQALLVVNSGLVALLGGLLGGRLVYVAVRWSYYQSHWEQIPQIFLGGIAWVGAFGGGLVALLLYAGFVRQSSGFLLDSLLPLVGLLSVSAWLACWLDGCAYGAVSTAWWALPARNEWGVITPRVPVQLIGAMLALITFGVADWARPRFKLPGQVALLALAALAGEMFALSFLRADPAPAIWGLHLESWAALSLSLVLLLVFAGRIVHARWRKGQVDQSG